MSEEERFTGTRNALMHPVRKFPSVLGKRVYDHAWRIRFLNAAGQEVFRLDPYILHGPDPRDNGLAEIKNMAKSTREQNRSLLIKSCKIAYLGTL